MRAKDVTEMFTSVTDAHDQNQFFQTARALVHIDGDYGAEEQENGTIAKSAL